MKPDQLIPPLEELAAALGVQVRYEGLGASGVGSTGGLCKVRGEHWLIIDKKSTPSERVAMLVDALATFEGADAQLGALAAKHGERIPEKVGEMLALRRKAKAASSGA